MPTGWSHVHTRVSEHPTPHQTARLRPSSRSARISAIGQCATMTSCRHAMSGPIRRRSKPRAATWLLALNVLPEAARQSETTWWQRCTFVEKRHNRARVDFSHAGNATSERADPRPRMASLCPWTAPSTLPSPVLDALLGESFEVPRLLGRAGRRRAREGPPASRRGPGFGHARRLATRRVHRGRHPGRACAPMRSAASCWTPTAKWSASSCHPRRRCHQPSAASSPLTLMAAIVLPLGAYSSSAG
jgi:hypothetical protein